MPPNEPQQRQRAVDKLRTHPCFSRAKRIYSNALVDWHGSSAIRDAAATLGMDRRAYCDARLSANQFQWTAPGTGEPFTVRHLECAWGDAADLFVPTGDRAHAVASRKDSLP